MLGICCIYGFWNYEHVHFLYPNWWPFPRTDVLVKGFKGELDTRLGDIKASRLELERLFALRICDTVIDEPENSKVKEECLKAIRGCEACFTSYNGSVRSIKSVLETVLNLFGKKDSPRLI